MNIETELARIDARLVVLSKDLREAEADLKAAEDGSTDELDARMRTDARRKRLEDLLDTRQKMWLDHLASLAGPWVSGT